MDMEKALSQMSKEEKLQELADYLPWRHERQYVSRYIQALRQDDSEQVAWFESFGQSIPHVMLNVSTYERGKLFGYADKRFDEYGWIRGMLPIVEDIELDTANVIHIGQSVNGLYAVTVSWGTSHAGGGSYPSVWDEPIADYKEAVSCGIRMLEQQYAKISSKETSRLMAGLRELKRKHTGPQQLSLF